MVETLTPAVCGSRQRYRIALALFTVGAVASAAALGALLGLVGSAFDRGGDLALVAALALLGAAREAGLLRFPLPGLRRQVPERWRREWPLEAWSLGYGAGLGAGVFTHQTVATFWVAAAGALAIGDPPVSALCLAPFGLGRALMVALPQRGGREPSAAVGRMVARRRLLHPVNAVVLALAALLLAAAPALGQAATTGRYDPAASGRILAVSAGDAAGPAVLVLPPTLPPVRFDGGSSPALDGALLAYADATGVRVVDWRSGAEVTRVDGALSKPALDYPLLAYVRAVPGGRRLELRNLVTGRVRVVASGGAPVDLGRPALRGGLIAWHVAAGRSSELRLGRADLSRPARVIASSVTGLQVNPSLAHGHVLWVEQAGSISALRLMRVGGGPVRTLTTLRGPNRILWTTALGERIAYATRWNPVNGRAEVISRRWR